MSSRRASSKFRPTDPEFWTVVNELPDPLQVSKAEIDAIERYFGDVLEAVFGSKPNAPTAAITTHQKGEKR
jgi:hypothetical protein